MSAGRSQTNPRDSPPMKRQVKRGNLGSTCRLSSLLQGFSQPLQRLCVGAIGPLVVLEGLRQPPCPQKQRQVFKAPARDCLFCSTWGSGVTACPHRLEDDHLAVARSPKRSRVPRVLQRSSRAWKLQDLILGGSGHLDLWCPRILRHKTMTACRTGSPANDRLPLIRLAAHAAERPH